MRNKPVRIGVVGVGRMGANHVRVYNQLKGVLCAGVFDARRETAERAAELYGVRAYESMEELAANVDAVSVATPSNTHAKVGVQLMSHGIHCLMEKPLATTVAGCHALIKAAAKAGVVLGVGHIERFNPAVQQLKEMLSDDASIRAITVRRLGHAGGRIRDVNVISDLMIHDLDIVNFLTNRQVKVAGAIGVAPAESNVCDHAIALLSIEGGGVANLEASRVTEQKIRELTVSSDQGFVVMNYINQDIMIYRSGALRPLPGDHSPAYTCDLVSQHVVVRKTEPLASELENFAAAAQGRVSIGVTGEEALAALQLVWAINHRLAA